jgi:hypothetical protein
MKRVTQYTAQTRNKLWRLCVNSQVTGSNHQQALAIIGERQRITTQHSAFVPRPAWEATVNAADCLSSMHAPKRMSAVGGKSEIFIVK